MMMPSANRSATTVVEWRTVRAVSDMLIAGELDAIYSPPRPRRYHPVDGPIVRLFPDIRTIERDYFRRTGIFPIMHLLGVRRELADRHPWLPMAIYKAFSESKRIALAALVDTSATKVTQVAKTGPAYTATQLRAALLPSLNGARPAVPVESGDYGKLPGVLASRQSLKNVKISPAKCASASATGLASAKFNQVPATVATFRDGTDGVSEVLLAPPASMLQAAITHSIPAGCSRYLARVGDRKFTYEIKQEPAPRLGALALPLASRP